MSVLVGDDDWSADQLCLALDITGFAAQPVFEESDAIAWISEIRPDVVVLDTEWANGAGYRIARALRNDKLCWDVAIIAFTHEPEDRVRSTMRSFEFDAYCHKDSGHRTLLRIIGQMTPADLPPMPGLIPVR